MLCSHCYKKIPEGEEIQKASSSFFRTSWGKGWGGSEVVCRRCAIKDRRRQKTYLVLFFAAFIIIFLSVPIIIFVTKINN